MMAWLRKIVYGETLEQSESNFQNQKLAEQFKAQEQTRQALEAESLLEMLKQRNRLNERRRAGE